MEASRIVPARLGDVLGDYATLNIADDINVQGKECHYYKNEAIR